LPAIGSPKSAIAVTPAGVDRQVSLSRSGSESLMLIADLADAAGGAQLAVGAGGKAKVEKRRDRQEVEVPEGEDGWPRLQLDERQEPDHRVAGMGRGFFWDATTGVHHSRLGCYGRLP
jgi:hypothetical protein